MIQECPVQDGLEFLILLFIFIYPGMVSCMRLLKIPVNVEGIGGR